MTKPITADVAVAHALCPRKAYLLLCTDEQGAPHDYPRILAADQRRNQASYVNGLQPSQGGPIGLCWDAATSWRWAALGRHPQDIGL